MTRSLHGLPGRLALVAALALLPILAFPPTASAIAANLTATSFTATETVALVNVVVGNYSGPCSPLACTASIDWGDGSSAQAATVVANGAGQWKITGSYTYAEDGTGAAGTYTTQVVVNNNGNNLSASGTATVQEMALTLTGMTLTGGAEPFNFSGTIATFTDVGSTDPASNFQVGVDWGDGGTNSAVVTTTGPGAYSISGAHTYADDGTFTVGIFLYENPCCATSTSATTTITITEGTITPGTAIRAAATEGTVFTGPIATFTATAGIPTADFNNSWIDWGDNASNGYGTTVTQSGGVFTVSGSNNYLDEGTYTVTVHVREDQYNEVATLTGTVVVAEADALVGQPANFAATEGSPFSGTVATFTGVYTGNTTSDFTALVDWGDGTSATAGTLSKTGGTITVSGTHTYADNGVFTTSVTLSDDAPSTMSAVVTSTATVAGIDSFTGTAAGPLTGVEGSTFNGTVATFTDTNTAVVASDLTATINWGDGTSSAGTVTATAGSITVAGSHTYDEGSYTYSVTLSDDAPGGATATVSSTATYTEAPITGLTTITFTATAGQAFTNVLVGTFSDPGGKEPAGYRATIDWKDGTSSAGNIIDPPGIIHVYGSHTYAASGTYTITTTLTDIDGGATASVTVAAVVAAASPGTPGPGKPLPLLPLALLVLGLGLGGATYSLRRRLSS